MSQATPPTSTAPLLRRVPWREVALTAGLVAALAAFTAAATWLASAAFSPDGTRAFTSLVLLVVTGFLVHYAYAPRERRLRHWLGFGACALLVFTATVPLVYLSWRIVNRSARRAG